MMNAVDRKSLDTFIIVAFGFSWLFWIAALLLGYQDMPFMSILSGQFENTKQIVAFILFRLGVYGPLIASIGVSYYYFKNQGLNQLFAQITKWRIDFKWYLYVLLIPVLINLIVVLIGLIIGIPINSFFDSTIPLSYILIFLLYQVLTSGLEEPGWRGFALGKLQNKYTSEKASWILGLIWAVWHYPYLIYLYSQSGIVSTIFTLAGFTMAIIGQTFIFTWFYNNTKSVLIAIIFHAWLNTSTTFILGEITITHPIVGTIPALVTWAIVVVLLRVYGGKTLTKA